MRQVCKVELIFFWSTKIHFILFIYSVFKRTYSFFLLADPFIKKNILTVGTNELFTLFR